MFQTDMAAHAVQMFAASEVGGLDPPSLLSEINSTYNGEDVLIPNQANVQAQVNKLLNG